jgi:Mg2+ and Co2+ transporter CorA
MADNQNKTIFAFSAVTIVFLPLSFFASYFELSVKGGDKTITEEYFWKVGGTVSFFIILLVFLWSFRYRILRRLVPVNQINPV